MNLVPRSIKTKQSNPTQLVLTFTFKIHNPFELKLNNPVQEANVKVTMSASNNPAAGINFSQDKPKPKPPTWPIDPSESRPLCFLNEYVAAVHLPLACDIRVVRHPPLCRGLATVTLFLLQKSCVPSRRSTNTNP